MTVNDASRVPGHYKSEYLHWDFVIEVGMDYFAGNATKYISRWRKKGGVADLKKALHYIDKLSAVIDIEDYRGTPSPFIREEVDRFCSVNALTLPEHGALVCLAQLAGPRDLEWARELVMGLITVAETPATDSNKHALNTSEKMGHDGPRYKTDGSP